MTAPHLPSRKPSQPLRAVLAAAGLLSLVWFAVDLRTVFDGATFADALPAPLPDRDATADARGIPAASFGGRTARLLSIAEPAGDHSLRAWRADGVVTASPGDLPFGTYDVGDPRGAARGKERRICVSLAGGSRPPLRVGFAPDTAPGVTDVGMQSRASDAAVTTAEVSRRFPASMTRAAVWLGCADSNRAVVIGEMPAPGAAGGRRGLAFAVSEQYSSFFRPAPNADDKPTYHVTVTFPPSPRGAGTGRARYAYKVCAVDMLGNVIPSDGGATGGRSDQAYCEWHKPFLAPVRAIRLLAAPYQWVRFADLPLDYDRAKNPAPEAMPWAPEAQAAALRTTPGDATVTLARTGQLRPASLAAPVLAALNGRNAVVVGFGDVQPSFDLPAGGDSVVTVYLPAACSGEENRLRATLYDRRGGAHPLPLIQQQAGGALAGKVCFVCRGAYLAPRLAAEFELKML